MAAKRKRKAAKPAKEKKVKAAKAEKEPKEIKPGPPVESVVAVVTGLMLVVALLMFDYARGVHYGEGMFFGDKYAAAQNSAE
ncbi:MAG: hypothetical protein HQ519_05255 [Planctomycetes bacterium]|nr:hypothetical protein [Planctomycetota bacterium]NQU48033.1 hypothetical protein [Planctomycetota bacterium]